MDGRRDGAQVDRYVFDFTEGSMSEKDRLGGKGANLAEMVRLGLPVPPGFTITTDACRYFLAHGEEPAQLPDEVSTHLARMESEMGRRLGATAEPLLVSVRSGAKFSMPGMMETVLNIGLNDDSVAGLAAASGSERFAWDSYRRLVQMFGRTVMGVDGEVFETRIEELKTERGVEADTGLTADDLRSLVESFKRAIHAATGRDFPQDPREQLDAAIRAVFTSWTGERAVLYRRQERIPHDLGTAVNVQAMVFGNLSDDSGTGVCFTRDPATGATGVYGDFLMNAQGEDVVAGIRNTSPLAELEHVSPAAYVELRAAMDRLEGHYRDLCDIEFTIERGRLWMLQTRVGKRTAEAAFRIACQLVDEGVIDAHEALRRVTGQQLSMLMFPRFATDSSARVLTRAVAASPGAAVGAIVFDSATAARRAAAGEDVILVRAETTPDDLEGMIAARGILTSRGGKTSHAAVVARGMGKTCVCGAESLVVDVANRSLMVRGEAGHILHEGDVISIDGSTGEVFEGAVDVVPSPVVDFFEGRTVPDEGAAEVVRAVARIMAIADDARRLKVRANADTPEDAARAVRFGAEGIGLCRTEHMFLGERRELVEHLILAEGDAEREGALEALRPLQKQDFVEIFRAMGDRPVTVRLIDPPLHEFLPNLVDLTVDEALATERGESDPGRRRMLAAVERLHESNPMFGLRGVRLGIARPGLFAMQIRAILEAFVEVRRTGHHGTVEIMVPLVDSVEELDLVRAEALEIARAHGEDPGPGEPVSIGTMMELPRACLTAGAIAGSADFFSFGTNDLTQTTWGFSRDDVESSFFSTYLEKGVFPVSPFETLDVDGVGRLITLAVSEGRARKATLKTGVCGEHGGDPESVDFFHRAGLDYVSCSPFRVPIARLEAGRAAVAARD